MKHRLPSCAAAILAAVLLSSCDYTVPLVTTPELPVDRAWLGAWQRTRDDGQVERLLLLPLGTCEYLLAYPAGETDTMFARACRWAGPGLSLLQVEWVGNAKGGVPDDGKVYQYAACQLEDGALRVRLLNSSVVSGGVTSAAELVQALAEHRSDEDLFRPDMVFTNITER